MFQFKIKPSHLKTPGIAHQTLARPCDWRAEIMWYTQKVWELCEALGFGYLETAVLFAVVSFLLLNVRACLNDLATLQMRQFILRWDRSRGFRVGFANSSSGDRHRYVDIQFRETQIPRQLSSSFSLLLIYIEFFGCGTYKERTAPSSLACISYHR